MNNLTRILILIVLCGCFFALGYYKGDQNRGIRDDVESLKIENMQLITENNQKAAAINELVYYMNLVESTNRNFIDQLTTLKAEYNYANSVITKYQKRLNSLTHIDRSFVRYIQLTQTADKLSSPLAYADLFSSTAESTTASGILHYITALQEWGNDCVTKNYAKDIWYNNDYAMRERYYMGAK